jgi:hypothetical protein
VAFLKQSGQELAVSVSSQKHCLFHSWGPDRQLLENATCPFPAFIDRPPIERLFGGGRRGGDLPQRDQAEASRQNEPRPLDPFDSMSSLLEPERRGQHIRHRRYRAVLANTGEKVNRALIEQP